MTITSLALTCSNASSTKSERVKPIPPLWVCPRLCRHRPCYARWQLSRSRKWQSSVRSAESPQVVGTIYSIYIYISCGIITITSIQSWSITHRMQSYHLTRVQNIPIYACVYTININMNIYSIYIYTYLHIDPRNQLEATQIRRSTGATLLFVFISFKATNVCLPFVVQSAQSLAGRSRDQDVMRTG